MSKEITPGRWGDSQEVDMSSPDELAALELTSYPEVIVAYQLAMRAIGVEPKVIYYPCCGIDSSPSKAFPDAQVIYVDEFEPAIAAQLKAGYDAQIGDVCNFNPNSLVDLCILLNPQVPSATLVRSLITSGHVLCNNYHGTADQLIANPEFELLGFIKSNSEGQIFVNVEVGGLRENTVVAIKSASFIDLGVPEFKHQANGIYLFKKI